MLTRKVKIIRTPEGLMKMPEIPITGIQHGAIRIEDDTGEIYKLTKEPLYNKFDMVDTVLIAGKSSGKGGSHAIIDGDGKAGFRLPNDKLEVTNQQGDKWLIVKTG
ncbi:MAG: hypothetical protein KAS32_14540 [Candidatus Peribacteraceae bacterium]|nr:hypothetical protein [Candidatus Peribacteraceae bacterium]